MDNQIIKKFIDAFYGGVTPIIEGEEPHPGDLIIIKVDNTGERVDKAYKIRLYDDTWLRRIISNFKANEDKPSYDFQYKSDIERSFDEMEKAAKISKDDLTYEDEKDE